jgi:hypothetical protein
MVDDCDKYNDKYNNKYNDKYDELMNSWWLW